MTQVDTDQLTSALIQHVADPANVRAAYERKRRRSARLRYAVLGGITAVVLGAGAVTAARPWASAPPSIAATQSACAHWPLRQRLIVGLRKGASVIVASGKLTGYNANTSGGYYSAMRLRGVQTLAGPPLKDDRVWLMGIMGPDGPDYFSEDTGALWSTDGGLFAIVSEGTIAANSINGPILTVAPVVNGHVIFSMAGCWNAAGLHARPYHGPLAQIPGSQSYQRSEANGFWAVPLSTVEAVIASAEKSMASNG